MKSNFALVPALLLIALTASPLLGQRITGHFPNPDLESVFPMGAQAGETQQVRVLGRDLNGPSELRFSHPGISAKRVTASKAEPDKKIPQGTFDVTVSDSVPPGVYEVRVLGTHGLSTPRAFAVSNHAELLEVEPNSDPEQAQAIDTETILNGRVHPAGDRDCFRLSMKSGERVLIRCLAESIDSKMEVAMTLRDPSGSICAVDHDTVHRDGLIDFTSRVAGDHVLEVRDLIHEGSTNHGYRLMVTRGAQLDFASPSTRREGSDEPITLFGRSLPGGEVVVGSKLDGQPIERLTVDWSDLDVTNQEGRVDAVANQRRGYHITAPKDTVRSVSVRLPEQMGGSNAITVGLADNDVTLESPSNDHPQSAQVLELPAVVAGQFHPDGDRDWFRFHASKGDVLEIDVVAQRQGIASDAFLLVQKLSEDGKTTDIASVDDQTLLGYDQNTGGFQNTGRFAFNSRTDDPSYQLKVPEDGDYLVMVRDLNHTNYADPRFSYRLTIRKPKSDFQLVATAHTPVDLAPNFRDYYPWTPVLNPGGTAHIDVQAFRWGGFSEPIQMRVEGLPAGVSCETMTFHSGQTAVPLILRAEPSAKPWAGVIEIVAEAEIDGKPVMRKAEPATVLWKGITQREGPRSRKMLSMPLSVVETPATLKVTAPNDPIHVKPGQKLKVPVTVVRGNGFAGPVQITNIGLPKSAVSLKPMTIAKTASEGQVELTILANAKPATHTFCLDAKIDLPDPRVASGKGKSIAVLVSSTPIRIVVEKK